MESQARRSIEIAFVVLFILLAPRGQSADEVIRVGSASYTTRLPAGAKLPPPIHHRGSGLRGKIPSNDWWSSLLWSSNTFEHFPHPLAVKVENSGLRVAYPGANLTANKAAIFGSMPGGTNDFILGHSAQAKFPTFTVEDASDWFVTVQFADVGKSLRVSYGHGSPFVFATTDGGAARLTFANAPQVWSDDASTPTLGLSINGRHYGLFAPAGAKWNGVGSSVLSVESAKNYFSVATLPDAKPETMALFQKHAHAHVTDTRVEWSYDEKNATVTTKHKFTTKIHEGAEAGTLFALYPHQWRNTALPLLPLSYGSVRGAMKLGTGGEFTTSMKFPGVLPALPKIAGMDSAKMDALLKDDFAKPVVAMGDTYWSGKQLGKLATAIPLAEVHGLTTRADDLRKQLQGALEAWFTATNASGTPKTKNLFYYDEKLGTLTGYPASYGSDTELNDHHFHYGYFLKAAAEIARHDPVWASDARFGGLLKLIIRDIVSPTSDDPMFPRLRCFDPYAGHSWASGHSRFADGNNNESSSEAMNAWCGIILLGEATGDRTLRDLGIYLFTTELNAINEYWFNVHGDNFPASYPASVVTMVWGGKGANGTWFSADPQMVHGINFLPLHGGSLYLGLYPNYVEKNYGALVKEFGSDQFKSWPDVSWMYRALSDANDAARLFEAADPAAKIEGGNTRANIAHWIYALKQLGRPERSVTADSPIYAVFQNGPTRSYTAYNFRAEPRVVNFSDGQRLTVPGRSWATDNAIR
jgi:endoglucanase Acf2